jgi:hypothetical protein
VEAILGFFSPKTTFYLLPDLIDLEDDEFENAPLEFSIGCFDICRLLNQMGFGHVHPISSSAASRGSDEM